MDQSDLKAKNLKFKLSKVTEASQQSVTEGKCEQN